MPSTNRKQKPVFSGVPIPSYSGRYIINHSGEIYSLSKNRLLKPHISKSSGYEMCTLINDNGGKDVCYIHQLMAISFIDKHYKDKNLTVDHIDRDRSNNKLYNLRVVSQAVNNENKNSKNYYYEESRNKFNARIKRGGVTYRKRFTKEEDAIKFVNKIKNLYSKK